jgi:hypothetical protein
MRTTSPADTPLGKALRECAATRLSGVLRVDGEPGGTIHLAGGGIAACETPGAPGLEVILLRSGRIPESDWDAAFAASAAADGRMSAELIARGLITPGELEALLRTTLADAMFALVSGPADNWHTATRTADCLLSLHPAAKVGWLLAEATRRIQMLASFPEPPVNARDRIMAVPGAARPDRMLGGGRDEILALADGRRTARDLAFALGRGLYATMLQLSRMRADGLVVTVSPGAMPALGDHNGGPAPGSTANGGTVSALPQRRKDRPGDTRADETGRRTTPAIGLLGPRSQRNTKPSGMQ